MRSQTDSILGELQAGEHITPLDALNRHGCFRLAAIVFSLKKQGYDIRTDIVTGPNGKRFASYWLKSPAANQIPLALDL